MKGISIHMDPKAMMIGQGTSIKNSPKYNKTPSNLRVSIKEQIRN